jgi:DNA replication protein DnaC
MLIQPTLDTLNRLKLYGMAAAFAEQLTHSAATGLAFEDRLTLLLDREVVHRDNRRQAQNLLIHGATGCGKTFLACALAQQACRQGLSALYLRAPRLFDELSVCHADGSFRKRLAAIAKVDLVLIDDFAIAPMGPRERTDLLELLDDRVGTRSTLITSQLPVEHWHDYLGDPTLADAILDRLVHSAHKLHLEGESMRKRTAAGADKTPANKKKIDGA